MIKKVSPKLRKEMRALWPELTMREIGLRYNISAGHVSKVLKGKSHPRRLLDDQEVVEMRAAYPDMTLKQIAVKWGVSFGTARTAVSGKRYAHLPGAKETPNRGWAHMIGRPRPAKRKVNVFEKLLLHRL